MGLATIFSILAFFIAMLALWLSSDTVKKVENQNEKFLTAHIGALREELRDLDKMLNKTLRLAQQNEQGHAAVVQARAEQDKLILALQDQVLSVGARLEALDQSIPQRYRVKPLKADVRQGQKASIQ